MSSERSDWCIEEMVRSGKVVRLWIVDLGIGCGALCGPGGAGWRMYSSQEDGRSFVVYICT
jgi:hypothetical protein